MSKRIKILFTIPNFDTAGSGNSVYDMVKGLNKALFDPEICCFHNRGEFFTKIETLNVKTHLFPFTTPYYPLITFPQRVLKISLFFRSLNADIIHSWHWSSDFSEPLAAKLAGIPFVYTKKAMGWGNKAWRWRSKLSTKIVAVNEEMIDKYFSNMHDKVVQIPLVVDTDYFKPLSKSYTSPEGLSFEKDDFVILSVANLVPVKGIEILLQAILKINEATIKVLVVGDNNNEYGIALKEQYDHHSNIMFFGKQLDVRPYLALADVFVIPTKDEGRREGLPVAPMEAMAVERIVLGSNVSGIKEVLKAFPECLFQASDVTGLADKIKQIKQMSFIERKALAQSMRAYVEKELSIKTFINEHEILYKKILVEKP
ncbi:glycosyltransferase [Yeosuana sp. MJ-SS3]|uniref:Glycosyltransferase n=1 Tax=Gilvirhabdus luticola TaxID=3079858 RepID=A0ABU3U5R2_9FLAO|nr:glycosyltransferase [Yeosuana sp. MJ-SS3]MDU8885465.1 glycosyltransferase [Yeosuana sp. MJ-SS3]